MKQNKGLLLLALFFGLLVILGCICGDQTTTVVVYNYPPTSTPTAAPSPTLPPTPEPVDLSKLEISTAEFSCEGISYTMSVPGKVEYKCPEGINYIFGWHGPTVLLEDGTEIIWKIERGYNDVGLLGPSLHSGNKPTAVKDWFDLAPQFICYSGDMVSSMDSIGSQPRVDFPAQFHCEYENMTLDFTVYDR